MKKFRPSLITTALLASGMTLTSISALAQETELQQPDAKVDQIEKIEVKGFRTSLIKSLNQKRFSDTVSEQLSADDLGGLPDVSMADALTRLPGISAVRTGGQAAEINIRGLSGDFVFSTLNGREQVSTSGSRSIEFDQYPSELISSAAVYKSPKASLIEGGVAGTVELQTASPLSISEDYKFNMNVRGMYNDRAGEVSDAEEFGHRISFSFQTKMLDDTLGLALGYARLFQPSVSTQFIGLAYNTERDVDFLEGDEENYDPTSDVPKDQQCIECEFVSEGFEMQHKGGEETRDGYMAAIEWAPTDNFVLKTDAFYSRFDSEEFARGFRVKLEPGTAVITNPVVDNNTVIGGTFSRGTDSFTRVELVNDDNQDFDEIQNFGLNADWQATDNLNIKVDFSYSKAKSEFRNGLLWSLVGAEDESGTPRFDTDISISYLLNGLDLPDIGFSQFDDFSDVNNVYVTKYGIYPYENEDELFAYRLDLTYEVDNPFISSFEVGVRYSDREYSNDRSVYEYGSDSSFSASQPPLALNDQLASVVNWEGDFGYFPSYLSVDLDSALSAWFPEGTPQPVQTWGAGHPGVINSPGGTTNTAWSVLESGEVYEKVLSAYIMANIDTEIGDLPITGNIGIRRVETEQSSTFLQDVSRSIQVEGTDPDTGETILVDVVMGDPELGAQLITDEVGLINNFYRPELLVDKYTDYLPSFNLNFKLTEQDQLRFAAAKVMGRPPINRLFANSNVRVADVNATMNPDSGEISVDRDAELSGSSTNSPYLRPFYANQYDISYEHYFDETDGAIVVALFYKDIKSFINDFTIDPFDFAGNGFQTPSSIEVPVFLDSDDPSAEATQATDANGEPLFITVPTTNGPYTTAVNNREGGYIRGIELAYTQVYSYLPAPWDGLGVSASYSYTESEIQFQTNLGGTSVPQQLPGLSETVVNGTFFWEYEDFETRVNVRWRDAFVSKQVAVNEQIVNFDDELIIDYQASYDINDNLGVLFQINNLTDAPTKSYFGRESQTGTIQYFGTQYFLGVTYSL
ncbi:TonB-dependent receptor [Aliiglaciecola lipolytica]|uniref:TonB-dependent receptor n=1 Tax=Aliiglaciecola lipolytica TaxID=477689 RepID=UPI001C0A0454|nr:TonB-dependent receptor [Aliiglaciecola lipolytica]MBU2876136.1 TonB-dependent receptor [Aliiglaciecola lipolytica]